MKYICLLYADESKHAAPGTPEFEEVMKGYAAFNETVESAGVYVGGEPLEDAVTASTVNVRDGNTSVTDGPFAETKEQLGGYYILDCETKEQALKYAAQIPAAEIGYVEVRPLMVIPGLTD